MGSLQAREWSSDSVSTAPAQPTFNDVAQFYDKSHLGWTTDRNELAALEKSTRSASVRQVAGFISEHSSAIEALSPKGKPGELTNGDLKLYRNLSEIDTAVDSVPFLDATFIAADKNKDGKLTRREVRKFAEKNSSDATIQNGTDNILSGFGLIARASGKGSNSIDAKDVTALKNDDAVMAMMHKEFKMTEFARRSAPISLTVGGTLAVLASMGDGTQAEKQRAAQNGFRTGALLGTLVSYPLFNKSIENYYEKSGRDAITKLFG